MILPIGDRIIVRITDEEKRIGEILLPDNYQSPTEKGTVVAAGTGIVNGGTRVPLTVKEGDLVIFFRGTGIPLTDEGRSYVIIQESHVLGYERPEKGEAE